MECSTLPSHMACPSRARPPEDLSEVPAQEGWTLGVPISLFFWRDVPWSFEATPRGMVVRGMELSVFLTVE